ncbi:MAG: ABC transporter ATP-binding protein [Deltaproteobacteria bacterium]|nr:MAG: ABC transporter ATP-binding protein [Deltaproteobacteria bacterium]
MARLVLEELDLWYSTTVHAVDHVSLVVEDGELCVLLGPSGCGKTSTLRMVAGFIIPTSGAIYLDDKRIEYLYPGDRNIAMVFQSYALYPNKTVRQHLAFALKKAGLSASEIEQRIQQTAEFMHMEDYLDRRPQALSSGQQQRVAVGRALIRRPKLFLMDEPLSQLDARLRVETRSNLRRLQQDLGITTVYVTHDQMEAQGLADKIVVMDRGRIQQVGSPIEIYEDPVNLFVAGFIGTPPMNFIEGELIPEDSGLCFNHPEFKLRLQPALLDKLDDGHKLDGRQAVIGIRPEYVQLAPEEEPNAIPAEVYVLEPQSNEYVVDLHMGEIPLKMRQDKRELGFKPEIGRRVWMRFRQNRMHLFDKNTGARLA